MIKENDKIQYGKRNILCRGVHVDWYNSKINHAKFIKKECTNRYDRRKDYYDEIINIKVIDSYI